MNTRRQRLCLGPFCLLAALACAPVEEDPASPDASRAEDTADYRVEVGKGEPLYIPAEDTELALAERAEAQQLALAATQVVHDFRFADRREQSGITFLNDVVDDVKRDFKAVHYDHGNGIAIADVDGDGRLDIYFTTQLGSNELWRNAGGGRFENVTETAGVALADRISVAGSFGDIDNDGDPDLYVTTVKMGNVLFENDGTGAFTDISRAAGLDYVGHSSGAIFFDYDRDGLLDLFVSNVGAYTIEETGRGGYYIGAQQAFSGHLFKDRDEPSRLYRNLGDKTFADVTAEIGLGDDVSYTGDAVPVDFNGDLFPDLYVLNMQGHDQYYVNRDGQRFERQSREVFPRTPWGSMGVKAFDYDNDGDFDLMLTDMHSDMSQEVGPEKETLKSEMQWPEEMLRSGGQSIFGNAFFRNDGDGAFIEVSDEVGTENYWPWGITVADINADGWSDVFIAASMSYHYRYGVNSMLLNDGGRRFLDAAFPLGIEPRNLDSLYIPWFDLDCSGADVTHERCRGQRGMITIHGTLGTRSSAIFDLDQDGDLDIVTLEFGHSPQVLISDLADSREIRFLKVRLVGSKSNRDALGATVTVRASGRSIIKAHDGVSGYLSHSIAPLYFGLGDAPQVDAVEVQWPSGATQVVDAGITINDTLVVNEP